MIVYVCRGYMFAILPLVISYTRRFSATVLMKLLSAYTVP